jgi:hypothetical protein
MLKKLFIVLLCGCALTVPLFAEETAPAAEESQPEAPLFTFALGIALGYDVFGENDSYQRIELKPDLGIGEFGLGLGLILHYRFTNSQLEVRSEDWVPDSDHSFWDLYLPIFRYVRYGQKGRPLFLKLGSMEDMTLGNGYIMGNYTNTLFMPQTRIVGLEADMDGSLFDFPLFGFETVIGNLSALDVLGGRLYVRPMVLFDIPILNDLQVGATYVVDRAPFRYVDDAYITGAGFSPNGDNLAQAFGVDLRQPFLTASPFTLALYGDLVWLNGGKAAGQMVGLGGKIIDIFTYQLQARFNGPNFVPVYFDATYDISRAVKYPLVESGTAPAYVGWFFSIGADIANVITVYIGVDGPFQEVDPTNPDNYLNYPHLRGIIRMAQGLVPGLTADLIYDKTLLGKDNGFFQDLFDPEGAVTSVKISYQFGPAVISLIYQIRYVPDATGNPWEITSSLESSVVIPF